MSDSEQAVHLFHGVDFLVNELGLGKERVGRRVVLLELGRQPLGVRHQLLHGDGHGHHAIVRGDDDCRRQQSYKTVRSTIARRRLDGRLRGRMVADRGRTAMNGTGRRRPTRAKRQRLGRPELLVPGRGINERKKNKKSGRETVHGASCCWRTAFFFISYIRFFGRGLTKLFAPLTFGSNVRRTFVFILRHRVGVISARRSSRFPRLFFFRLIAYGGQLLLRARRSRRC